jgi:hypothetical protein
MVHQSCSYLKLKGRTYYFSRRVPKRLQKHFKTDRVEVYLHTSVDVSSRSKVIIRPPFRRLTASLKAVIGSSKKVM